MELKKIEEYVFLIPIIIFCFIKIPHLSLPFFWDEAWAYYPAIKSMALHGPSLLPGAIPINYSKGHPQLFLFLISAWMNLNPGSIPFLRLFNLTISIVLLIMVYVLLRRNVNHRSAIMGISLISTQSLFLAQSSMIFPEVLATLFIVASVYFFYRRQFGCYALFSSLMVLTKETFILFAFTLGVYYLISLIRQENRKAFKISHLIFLFTPAIIYGIHLLLHYAEYGSIFYSDHTGYIDLRWDQIKFKFTVAFNTIFADGGRIYVSVTLMLILLASIIWKQKIKSLNLLWIMLACIFPYLIFSSMNFYTFRYMLAPLVLFVFVFCILFGEIITSRFISYSVTIILSVVCLYLGLTVRGTNDHTLGYIEVSNVQKDLVKYCETHELYNEPIATNFLVGYAFKGPEYGYRSTNAEFTQLHPWSDYKECKYFIYDLTPDVPDEITKEIRSKFILIKTFENKHAKGYIYRNENYNKPVDDNKKE